MILSVGFNFRSKRLKSHSIADSQSRFGKVAVSFSCSEGCVEREGVFFKKFVIEGSHGSEDPIGAEIRGFAENEALSQPYGEFVLNQFLVQTQ